MQTVTIFTTSWCGECHVAKRLFDDAAIGYDEVDIEDWDDPRGHLEELTGNRTVPQIVIGDKVLGGYDDLLALRRTGEIDRVLEAIRSG